MQSILSCLKLRKTALYISHDFIMGAFLAKIISGDLFTNGKIDYLNGVCFTLEDNNSVRRMYPDIVITYINEIC